MLGPLQVSLHPYAFEWWRVVKSVLPPYVPFSPITCPWTQVADTWLCKERIKICAVEIKYFRQSYYHCMQVEIGRCSWSLSGETREMAEKFVTQECKEIFYQDIQNLVTMNMNESKQVWIKVGLWDTIQQTSLVKNGKGFYSVKYFCLLDFTEQKISM